MLVLITYDVNTETAAGRARLRTVSYTHLDVYKRQVFGLSASLYVIITARLLSVRLPSRPCSPSFLQRYRNWRRRNYVRM